MSRFEENYCIKCGRKLKRYERITCNICDDLQSCGLIHEEGGKEYVGGR